MSSATKATKARAALGSEGQISDVTPTSSRLRTDRRYHGCAISSSPRAGQGQLRTRSCRRSSRRHGHPGDSTPRPAGARLLRFRHLARQQGELAYGRSAPLHRRDHDPSYRVAALRGARRAPRLGDIAAAVNGRNQPIAFGMVADVGPKLQIGEGPIALAKALALPADPNAVA